MALATVGDETVSSQVPPTRPDLHVVAEPLPVWKRAFDILSAGILLVIATPVLLALAIVTALVMGRPLLYRQARGGLGGSVFNILKFRTMSNERDEHGVLLPDEKRRHTWGNFLRRTSLDELPTLLNIIRGDMSFVGPRPLMAQYLDRYSEHQAKRHQVTPGLTGLAQTKGRNKLTWAERFELDLEYVQTRSLTTDLRILVDTVKIVVTGEGADGNDHCTEFLGTTPNKIGGSVTSIAAADGG